MKITLINFANEAYAEAQKYNTLSAKHIAKVDKVIECSPRIIDEDFLKKNSHIFSYKRGFGLWLWKPYFIKKYLDQIDENEYLFYSDVGAIFCRNIRPLIESMGEDDIWISDIPLIEEEWTKRDIFSFFNCYDDKIVKTQQMQASFLIFRKTEKSVKFVDDWLNACMNIDLLRPLEDGEDNGVCISHREDQSILSVMCKLNGIKPHKDPTQYGKFTQVYNKDGRTYMVPEHDDKYPIMIVHHRMAKMNNLMALKLLLKTALPNGWKETK